MTFLQRSIVALGAGSEVDMCRHRRLEPESGIGKSFSQGRGDEGSRTQVSTVLRSQLERILNFMRASPVSTATTPVPSRLLLRCDPHVVAFRESTPAPRKRAVYTSSGGFSCHRRPELTPRQLEARNPDAMVRPNLPQAKRSGPLRRLV
jgi:hypothetical protein